MKGSGAWPRFPPRQAQVRVPIFPQHPPPGRSRGLAAVELALLMPVYLMLMLGVAELGRACYEYNTLTKLVRTGAKYISREANNGAGVVELTGSNKTATRNLVVFGTPAGTGSPLLAGLSVNDITVTAVGSNITVSVSYNYTPLFTVIPDFGMGEGDINALGTMNASVTMVLL